MESSRLAMRVRALVLLIGFSTCGFGAGAIAPVTVCEILSNEAAYEGKEVAVLGRYSFRRDGRWIGEQACGTGTAISALWLTENSEGGPKPPGNFELDGSALNRKFAEMLKHTQLGKFRFGTADYDRWAVVYGRVELRKSEDAKKPPAELVFRGSGVVIFLTTER
jgi:hypothetical protein